MTARRTMTVAEVSRELGVSVRTCYAQIHAGVIPSVRLGRRIVIPRQRFERELLGGDAEQNGAGTDSPNANGGVGAPPLTEDKEYEHEKHTPASDGAGRRP